ncbi:hypothetical protein Hs30E_20750 [Lactococcus hodotermopsidis]|uniref:Uncharacterized protein n=1 Tax=Pseudolactococcus hodotermopsidis TaxID=2709157 RepID=A0A6A0BFD6_9LACT|nr:hypothetical protein [Lactococcus hodotermopsidis]GFH43486.1 hypothetical protein Hs30E_20750 [Lactococcus hodotermopsidis]
MVKVFLSALMSGFPSISFILKGAKIGSGSVVGALVTGKYLFSNFIYAGNPAKKVKEDIFFTENSSHFFTEKEAKEYNKRR